MNFYRVSIPDYKTIYVLSDKPTDDIPDAICQRLPWLNLAPFGGVHRISDPRKIEDLINDPDNYIRVI